MSTGESGQEKRDMSIAGVWNRSQFELSMKSIDAFGFSPRVSEYCRAHARATKRLPHQLVIEIVEEAVARASRTGLTG